MTTSAQRRTAGSAPGSLRLRPGWPVYALLYGYPLWWFLGLGVFIWFLAAIPAAFWLWGRKSVRVPPGFGTWCLFVAWMVLSGSQLEAVDDLRSFSVRAMVYVVAGVLFLYAYNLPPGHSVRMRRALFFFFGFVVLGGVAAIVSPVADFATPLERVLPRSVAAIPFLNQMVHGAIAQTHVFLGYPVNRPAAPFAFTNEWGAVVGILAPMAYFAAREARRGWWRLVSIAVLFIGLVPIVYSLNRGLWLSIAAAGFYVAARLAIHGRVRPLRNIALAALVLGLLVVTTPLGSLAAERLDTGHSDDARTNLVSQSIAGIAEAPILGHGGPRPDPEAPDRAPIGTHGQIWLVGFSHGLVGAVLYVGTLGIILVRSRRSGPDTLAFWANASVFVAIVQLPFYSHVPVVIQLVLLAGALALRQTSTDVDTNAHLVGTVRR